MVTGLQTGVCFKKMLAKWNNSGLVVSVTNPWLAASPDGLVYDTQADPPHSLVEFKNPY